MLQVSKHPGLTEGCSNWRLVGVKLPKFELVRCVARLRDRSWQPINALPLGHAFSVYP